MATDDLVVTAETVAAVTKLYVNTALDELQTHLIREIKTKIDRIRADLRRELSGPEPFAVLLKAAREYEQDSLDRLDFDRDHPEEGR